MTRPSLGRQIRLLALGAAIAIASCTGDDNDPASGKHIVILGAPIGGQVAVGDGFVLGPEVRDAMDKDAGCGEPFRWANSNPVALEMAQPNDAGAVLLMARREGTALLTVRCASLKASVSVEVIAAGP